MSRIAGREGFTLVEVLVAILLMGLVGVASAQTMAALIDIQGASAKTSRAIIVAQDAIEDLRRVDCASITSGSSKTPDGYSVVWDVTQDPVLVLDGAPELGMKLIELTVSGAGKGTVQAYDRATVFTDLSGSN